LFFRSLSEFADEINIQLNPMWIITDFEKAEYGLVTTYGNDIHFSLMIWHLFALPFLPPNKIPAGFEILKANMPPEAISRLRYSTNTKLYGGLASHWNALVEEKHVSIYILINELQKEQQYVDVQVKRILHREPRPKLSKYYIEKERRIMAVFNNQENQLIIEYLCAIAYNLSSYLSL
ncbi:5788_t:CDS:2, partial [Cetraspora pellucida]